jgi:hypothetical protein
MRPVGRWAVAASWWLAVAACGSAPPPAARQPSAPAVTLGPPPPPDPLRGDWDLQSKNEKWVTTTARFFRPTARCSAGPFVVRLPPVSSRWAHRIVLSRVASQGNGNDFSFSVAINGQVALNVLQVDTGYGNGCNAAPSPPSRDQPPAVTAVAAPAAAAPAAMPAPTSVPASEPLELLAEGPRPERISKIDQSVVLAYPRGEVRLPSVHWSVQVPDRADLTVVIWARQPIEAATEVFAVADQQLVPAIPDDAYAKVLEGYLASYHAQQQRLRVANRDCPYPLFVDCKLPETPAGPPPPTPPEVPPPRPSPDADWIPGYWTWKTDGYQWQPGAWTMPPKHEAPAPAAAARPAPAAAAEARPTPVPVAPPVPRAEAIPAAPAPGVRWVPGFWSWANQSYTWVPGRWVAPPAAALRWRPPLVRRRADGTIVLLPGAWIDLGLGR